MDPLLIAVFLGLPAHSNARTIAQSTMKYVTLPTTGVSSYLLWGAAVFLAVAMYLVVAEYTRAAPPLQEAITHLYPTGEKRRVEYFRGSGASRRVVRVETYHQDGQIIKRVDRFSGRVQYYDDLVETLRTSSGLRAYLDGAWERTSYITAKAPLEDGGFAEVTSKEFRLYSADTLRVVHFSRLRGAPASQSTRHFEAAFLYDILPPYHIVLRRQLYARSGPSAVKAKKEFLSEDVRSTLVDTVRVYRPDMFSIHTATASDGMVRYKRLPSGHLPFGY